MKGFKNNNKIKKLLNNIFFTYKLFKPFYIFLFVNLIFISACSNLKKNEDINICSNLIETFQNANAVIILTEWDEFKEINFEEAFEVMKKPAWVFDGRNILDHQKLKDIGFKVRAIGKYI